MPKMFLARPSKNKFAPIIPAVVTLLGFFMPPHGQNPVCGVRASASVATRPIHCLRAQVLLLVWTIRGSCVRNGKLHRMLPRQVFALHPTRQAFGRLRPACAVWFSGTKIAHRLARCGCSCPCPAGTLFCAHEDFTRASGNSWRS